MVGFPIGPLGMKFGRDGAIGGSREPIAFGIGAGALRWKLGLAGGLLNRKRMTSNVQTALMFVRSESLLRKIG